MSYISIHFVLLRKQQSGTERIKNSVRVFLYLETIAMHFKHDTRAYMLCWFSSLISFFFLFFQSFLILFCSRSISKASTMFFSQFAGVISAVVFSCAVFHYKVTVPRAMDGEITITNDKKKNSTQQILHSFRYL